MRKCLLLSSIITMMLIGGAGCTTNDNYCCENNDLCLSTAEGLHSCYGDTCAKCVMVKPLQITPQTLLNAAVGQEDYSVILAGSGGIPPYTWKLTRGNEEKLSWLTIIPGGDENEKGSLQNMIINNIIQHPTSPTTGDGLPLTITLIDSSRHGENSRPDNQGVAAQMTLKIDDTFYQLTVNPGTGGSVSPAGSTTVEYGAATTITATPTNGYSFVNWTVVSSTGVTFSDATNASTTVTLTGGDATIQANFTSIQYQLTVNAGSGGSVTPSGTVTVGSGSATPIIATPNAGYSFDYWSIIGSSAGVKFDSANSESTKVTLTGGNATIQANFKPITYQLTVNVNNINGGIVVPSGTLQVTYGVAQVISATANPGYSFVNWTVSNGAGVTLGNSNSSGTTVTLTGGNATIQANFTPITYNLTVTVNTSSGGTASPSGTVPVIYGADNGINATLKPCYSFTGWTIIGSSTGVTFGKDKSIANNTVKLTGGDATIQANFALNKYTLTVNAGSGGGSVTPTNPQTVNCGSSTPIPITASPSKDYKFVGWTASPSTGVTFDNAGSPSANVTFIGSDTTVSANFAPLVTDVYVTVNETKFDMSDPNNLKINYLATVWKNGALDKTLINVTKNSSYTASAESVFVLGNDVYVAGNESSGTNGNGVVKVWKNGGVIWQTDGTHDEWASSVFVTENGDFYVAGQEDNGTTHVATVWENGNAIPLTDGICYGWASSVFVSGGNVYVAGSQGTHSQAYGWYVAKVWTKLKGFPVYGTTSLNDTATISAMANSVFVSASGDIYVAGTQDTEDSVQSSAVVWRNGSVFETLTTPTTQYSGAQSVFIDGAHVYVSGINNSNSATVWKDGSTYETLGVPSSNSGTSGAPSIFVLDNVVYVAGYDASMCGKLWTNGVALTLPPTCSGQLFVDSSSASSVFVIKH